MVHPARIYTTKQQQRLVSGVIEECAQIDVLLMKKLDSLIKERKCWSTEKGRAWESVLLKEF